MKKSLSSLIALSRSSIIALGIVVGVSAFGFFNVRISAEGNGAHIDDTVAPEGSLQYVVNSIGDGGLVGPPTACDDGTGNCTLRAAIQAANAHAGDDNISFSITGTINLTGVLPDLSSNMSITGPGPRLINIRRDTGGDYRIFNVLSGVTLTLSGITVSGGFMPGGTNGGGIQNAGTLTIDSCVIGGNQATARGGGIYNTPAGNLTMTNSVVIGNVNSGFHGQVVSLLTGRGGGIANYGVMRITNCTIYGNSAYGQEMGVFQGGGEGGGIRNGGNLTVTNTTITGNNCLSPPGTLLGFGGGIYSDTSSSQITVKSSIIGRNIVLNTSYRDVYGAFTSQGFNIIGESDGSSGFTLPTDQKGAVGATLDPGHSSGGPTDNGGPTNTIKLLPGSIALDKGSSAGLTGPLSTDQRGIGFPRTNDDIAIPNATGGDGTDVGAFEIGVPKRPRADFDGDFRTDLSIFRNGNWFIRRSSAGDVGVEFGVGTDVIAPGDYDGDGKADIAVYRVSHWYIVRSSDSTISIVRWGASGDISRAADYDGDNKTDVAVYRPSSNIFYVLRSSDSAMGMQYWGIAGDVPVVGDFDGDNRADYGAFREGTWHILRSAAGYIATSFGVAGDRLVPADYDGDGRADIAVFRSGTWYLLRSSAGFTAVPWGVNTDTTVPGDYDGDGKDDVAVFRDSIGTWYINKSSGGTIISAFGASGDVAVPAGYVP